MKLLFKIVLYLLGFLLFLLIANFVYFGTSDCGINPINFTDYAPEKQIEASKIAVGNGPEDFAIDNSTGEKRLIVSCSPRRGKDDNGSFHAINFQTQKSYPLTIIPPDLKLKPHGIDIVEIDSITYLYAINHAFEFDKIMKFEIRGDTLINDRANFLQDPKTFKALNDLDVLSDGSLYATNYLPSLKDKLAPTKAAFGAKTGSVVYCDNKANCKIVLTDKCYPNGILADEKNKLLFLANGGCREVLKYPMNEDGSLNDGEAISTRNTTETAMADNLLMDDFGIIWTTTHPKPLKFLDHAKEKADSPSQVFKIDPATMKAEMVYQNNGDEISAASTAIKIDDKIYVSQVFDPFVLVLN